MATVAELAYALIAVFEGERLTAYQDSGGVWTIGLGHTGAISLPNPPWSLNSDRVVPGMTITHDEAIALFEKDAAPLFSAFRDSGSTFRQAALVSFAYNVGLHTAKNASMETMIGYVHDRHGNELPGLIARRRLEALLASA